MLSLQYCDRYIQNPVAIALLGSIVEPLKNVMLKDSKFGVVTLFRQNAAARGRAFDDWPEKDAFIRFSKKWLNQKSGVEVEFFVGASNRDAPHHRKLTLEFDNGAILKIRFDQGMGYWQIQFATRSQLNFDFEDEIDYLLAKFAQSLEGARVKNYDQKWPTDILVGLEDV